MTLGAMRSIQVDEPGARQPKVAVVVVANVSAPVVRSSRTSNARLSMRDARSCASARVRFSLPVMRASLHYRGAYDDNRRLLV
ncbi:unannotated protein [freshwater metagenome]|uniref:Unannotated protein n=1 Tax=freshwater metagenome TaxID=449393 RepID=A0A6J7NQW8_9ZZZZ